FATFGKILCCAINAPAPTTINPCSLNKSYSSNNASSYSLFPYTTTTIAGVFLPLKLRKFGIQICGILPVYTGIPTTNNSFSPQTIGSVIFLRSKWYVSLSLQNLAAILFVIFWVVPAGLKSICFTNLYSFSILLFPIIIT